MTLIELDNVGIRFRNRVVLEGCSLTVTDDLNVAVMGPSGSGKSTLLAVVAGHQRPHTGERTALADVRVAWIVQSAPVLPARTALDNVVLGALATGRDADFALDSAATVIDLVGLSGVAAQRAGSLSGGERQRLAIARAMVADSDLILADEPTASLDGANRDAVGEALAAAASTKAVICASHDHRLVSYFERTLHLVDGRLE